MADHKDTVMTKFLINGTEVKGLDLDSIPIPAGKTDDKKVTTLGSYVHIKALNMYDPGDCDIDGLYIPGDAGQQALDEAFRNRTECTFQVVLTESGTTFEYRGYVSLYNPRSDDNTAKFKGTILATGLFNATTTYAGVTKVEPTTGTIIPSTATTALGTNDNDLVINELTATTKDTIKVTAATAIYIGYSLDDGKTWTKLTTATVSGDINMGSASTVTKVLLKIEELDMATRFINLYFARA